MNMMSASAANCGKLELAAEEVDGVRARCIQASRKPSGNKLSSSDVHVSGGRRSDKPDQPTAALTEEN